MVVNKKGGNKTKKQKKVSSDVEDRKLVLKNTMDLQEYAQITKIFGNGRFEANCFDGKIRLSHARGSLKKKKMFVKAGDIVIVSLREFQDAKSDIIYVYNQKEVRVLKKMGEIPNTVSEDLIKETEETDIGFDFNYEEDEEDDDEKVKKEDFKKDFEANFEAI
jgi:translation initiation factor 1A